MLNELWTVTKERACDSDMEEQSIMYSQEFELILDTYLFKREARVEAARKILTVLSQATPHSSNAMEHWSLRKSSSFWKGHMEREVKSPCDLAT